MKRQRLTEVLRCDVLNFVLPKGSSLKDLFFHQLVVEKDEVHEFEASLAC